MSQVDTTIGRDGFEHRFVGDMLLDELQNRMEQVLSSDPQEWDEDQISEWDELSREITRRKNGDRVFSIGDEAVLVGYKLTNTSGAVSYLDEYNKEEIDVIVTGYNPREDKWEVMITEDVMKGYINNKYMDRGKWRDVFIDNRPANGGSSGYVIVDNYRGKLQDGHRQRGIYKR